MKISTKSDSVKDNPSDIRPKTVVLHQFAGMGDLVWHVPYFRAVAEQSYGGQVAVIASPSTFARDLLQAEASVSDVIDFDWRPRQTERRRGRHAGLFGLFRMAAELKEHQFDRIVLFSDRPNRGLMAWLAKIPERIGYGSFLQRPFLSHGPYVKPYKGPSVSVYKDASAFAVAHGFVRDRVVPKLSISKDLDNFAEPILRGLPRPMFAFAIGSSEPVKQWGAKNFGLLADALAERGCGIVLLGGPSEAALAAQILQAVAPQRRGSVVVAVRNTVSQTAAVLQYSVACIGNDTGVSNLAAAVDRPSYVLLGDRPLLDHDPLMRMLRSNNLASIDVSSVLNKLTEDGFLI